MPWNCEPVGKSTRAIHQRLVMGATRCLSSPQLSDLLLNLTYIPVGLQHLPVFSTNTKAKAGLRQAQRRCRYRLYYSVFQTASSHWQASLSKQRSFNFFDLVLLCCNAETCLEDNAIKDASEPFPLTPCFASQTIADFTQWGKEQKKKKKSSAGAGMKILPNQVSNSLNPCRIKMSWLVLPEVLTKAGMSGTCPSSNSHHPSSQLSLLAALLDSKAELWAFLGTKLTTTLSLNSALGELFQA